MRPLFPDSATCRTRAHCETCRDPGDEGQAWRRGLVQIARLPADGPDFGCPHGLSWGFKDGPETLVAPLLAGSARGRLTRKPWDFRVCAVIPHLNTPDLLPVVIELLRLQTERPYVLIVDTGSPWSVLDELEKLRAPDVEIHYLRTHGTPHSSDPVCHAMDVGFSLCRSSLLFATHSDVFLRRREFLKELADQCSADVPVVGYEMSPRDRLTDAWKGCVGHTATMHHMETMDRLGVTWSIRRAASQWGEPRTRGVWPDTETTMNFVLRDAGIKPKLIGHETNGERFVDTNVDHCRSTTGTKLMGSTKYATRVAWLEVALREARERIERWRAEAEPVAPPAPPNPWAAKGPQMWREYHGRPARYAGDAVAERAWLVAFAGRLGCGDCLRHWVALDKAIPHDLTGSAAYARSQHARHDAVNARLGKRAMPWEDAARAWAWEGL
jgi:hypothetical protein